MRETIPSQWPTYGGNARRTSANKSWCNGPLHERWSFHPEDLPGRTARAEHVAVDSRGVFVAGELGESTVGYGLHLDDGALLWTFDSRTDIHHARWPTLTPDWVVLNDDGLFVLDASTGIKQFDKGLDWWGQTLMEGERLFLVNTYHVHGPPVFVGALDKRMEPVWQRNIYGSVAEDYRDRVGAIALDGGTLFQAVDHRYGAVRGLFAFEAQTGQEQWSVQTVPASALSASDGRLFLVEREEVEAPLRLVARDQLDGEVWWTKDIDGTDRAAPAVMGSSVIAFERPGVVVARDTKTGETKWSQAFSAPSQPAARQATHVAIAGMSRSVVVAAGDALAVLSLDDGRVRWQGKAPGDGPGAVHSPVVAGGSVYVVREGTVFALECAQGP